MLARLTSDFLYIVTIRRLNHDYVGLCKHRCTIVWCRRSDPGFSPLGLGLTL
jgi:hypothetical protein